jgi:hypothetical protein
MTDIKFNQVIINNEVYPFEAAESDNTLLLFNPMN